MCIPGCLSLSYFKWEETFLRSSQTEKRVTRSGCKAEKQLFNLPARFLGIAKPTIRTIVPTKDKMKPNLWYGSSW